MTAAVDVRRLVRIVAVLACMLAASLVYLSFAPDVDAATMRIDQAEMQLDSDRTTAFEVRTLRSERSALAARYAKLFGQNPEAVFLRALAADVARHGVTLVSTAESKGTAAPDTPATTGRVDVDAIVAERTVLTVSLRGTYRSLLATIAEMSLGPEIVRIDPPTLSRERGSVDARVPVTIYEPGNGRSETP